MIVRAGIGHLIILDSDDVSVTNKNRQLLALDSTVGKPKCEVLAARLKDINPELDLTIIQEYLEADKVKPKNIKSKFPGKLIILTGKKSCSSSEHAVIEAKGLFSKTNQFFQIGENSAGCYDYGNVWCYQLINSGIALHLASYISLFAAKCPEGWGIAPDYWATNDDLVKAIVNVTGDQELSEKLKDINKDL